MKGRPVLFDTTDIILKAQQVFWEKGYSATSLSDLQQATGMGSGSFYNTFKGGKKELFIKALQQRREAFTQFRQALNKSEAPVEMIKDFFRSIAGSEPDAHAMGCIIANTVTEMTFIDEELEKEAVEILKETEKMYTVAIKKAQQAGQLKNKTAAEILGRYLITFWGGLNVLRRMYPDKKILKKQIELQLELIS